MVDGEDAAREDLIASGGLPEAMTPNEEVHATDAQGAAGRVNR